MSEDYSQSPEWREWERQVREGLVPRLEESAVTVSIVPAGESDVKFAVELGLSIMLGKPIILVVRPGVRIPAKLVQVADQIIETDLDGDPRSAMASIQAALSRLLGDGQ